MLGKLNLDGTKEYEKSVATIYVSEMLVAFIQGRKHIKSIGAEQGDIGKWDDLILEYENRLCHFQIKRQNTDFSKEPCIRNTYTKQARKGQFKDLSEFDKTIKSLADWSKDKNPNTLNPKRLFEIYLPEGTVHIKDEIQINVLKTLCENHIKTVTTAQGLADLQAKDTSVNHCYNWLTTWCEFQDWEHILKALRILKIFSGGSSDDIDTRTKSLLACVYNSPDLIITRIKGYIVDNATFTGAITPRPLFELLKSDLLTGIPYWTQFEMNGANWELSGTHDTEDVNEIERPIIVIPKLWNIGTQSNLKIIVPNIVESALLNKVLHLALHIKGVSNSHILNHKEWKQIMSAKIGNTLGVAKNDVENLSFVENNSAFSTSNIKQFDTSIKQDNLANEIDNEIIKTTWLEVVVKLNKLITEMKSSEIKNAIEERWKVWNNALKEDISEQKRIFKIMLHPMAEGEDIDGELRIGTKTVDLIVDGLHLLLIVSIGLSDQHNSWEKISDNYSATTIGLSYWSGPSSKKRRVQDLDDEGIKDLIGQVGTEVLILSKVKSNETEIYSIPLARGNATDNSLAQQHKPKLIITNNTAFRQLINMGELKPLKEYLKKIIKSNEDSKNDSIEKSKI